MRPAILLALVACSSGSEPKPPPSVRFIGCQSAPPPPARPLPPQVDAPSGPGRMHGHGARSVRMRLNTPTVSGALEASDIRRSFRRVGPSLRACYERELAAQPTLGGVVTIKLTIAGTGKVATAEMSGLDELAPCIGDIVRAIEFPKSHDGLAVQVTQQIAFKLDEAHELPWTPYAVLAADDDAPARERVTAAVADLQPKIDACFGTARGSLRAMIMPAQTVRVRAGGLGDPTVEGCVADVLRGIQVPVTAIELACDFERGGPAPWRISPTGYERISPGAVLDESANPDASYLIVADRDATGDKIDAAATWASSAHIVAVAVTSDSGAPIFVGLAPSTRLPVETAPALGLAAKAGSVTTCDGQNPTRIADPHALDARFAALHEPVAFALTADVTAKELVGLASAATRAKLRFRVGGACR